MAFEAFPTSSFDAQPLASNRTGGASPLELHNERAQLLPASRNIDVTDTSGAVNFPAIYNVQEPGAMTAALAGDRQPAAPPAPATHDYVVHNGDSLWRIAKNSLTHGDRHAHVNGEQIWHRIKEIEDLNGVAHSGMRDNPFFLSKGDHITLPGAEDAQPLISRSTGRGHFQGPGVPGVGNLRPERMATPDVASQPPSPIHDGGHLRAAMTGEASHQARKIDTVGDCARGPRQTMEHFGVKLRPMSAVAQGKLLEASGLFDAVTSGEPQPGDYGYRHWSHKTISRRGVGDLGDAFIVTNCTRNGWQAANDHMFTVPPAGGYYAPGITFLRPNAKFYAAYEHYKQTGEKTTIRQGPNGTAIVSFES